jgi:hypothetical protein
MVGNEEKSWIPVSQATARMWAMEQRAAAVRPEKSQEEGRDQARLQRLSVAEGV